MKKENKKFSFWNEISIQKDGKWVKYFSYISQNELVYFKSKSIKSSNLSFISFLESKNPKGIIKFQNAFIQEKTINPNEKIIIIYAKYLICFYKY
jgi:hypothetical protein